MILHGLVMKVGCEMDAYVATTVVTMYSKCGETNLALRVFEWMSCKKVVSYNAMMYGLLQNGYPPMVFDLLRDMGTSLRENWVAIIDMYAKCGSTGGAYQIFTRLRDENVITWNSMIAGIFLCGQCDIAVDLFRQLESEGLEPDAVT